MKDGVIWMSIDMRWKASPTAVHASVSHGKCG